ncbi:MAG: hypothetical protein JNK12_23110 [Acidimicrobiales bacterium]|nr:hypothetical protein [Acidimicrobiales bacterium]
MDRTAPIADPVASTRPVGTPRPSLQERLEASPAGEIAISVLIAVILITVVAWSMPDSAIRRKVVGIVEPMALTSGLDQSWYMFAPNPYRNSETVRIHAVTAGGEERVWDFPSGGALTQFTWYRWHKLKEQAVRHPEIRAGVVRWAARQILEPSDYPAAVSMVLTVQDFPAPGVSAPPAAPATEVLHTEVLEDPP